MKTLHHKGYQYYIVDEETGEFFAAATLSYKGCKTKRAAYEKLFTELFKQLKEGKKE